LDAYSQGWVCTAGPGEGERTDVDESVSRGFGGQHAAGGFRDLRAGPCTGPAGRPGPCAGRAAPGGSGPRTCGGAARRAARQVPDGLKYAYIRIDRIAAESGEGKVLNDRVKALNDQKVRELNEKNKALQSVQQKLDSGGSVLNDTARAQLQAEVERQQRDIQRFTEDAQQDLQALQQQLQEEFTRKLNPILDKVAKEKQVAHGVQRHGERPGVGRPLHGPDHRRHQSARRCGAGARDGQARRARGKVARVSALRRRREPSLRCPVLARRSFSGGGHFVTT
jgi:Skp family chaperone for outer membrane proteins